MKGNARRASFLWVVVTALAGSAQGFYPSPDDWRDLNVYQIFTDRFADGDPGNNNANPVDPYDPVNSRRIHGGDFRGIEEKLDYIQALGANAIWISPIVLNTSGSSYHGYGAHDFYQLAPQWGTMADLTSMVAAAHARGIHVILDVVCNHQGTRIDSGDAGWSAYRAPPSGYDLRWTTGTPYPLPFDSLSYFHNNGHIGNWSDPEQIYGEVSGLDDLKTETSYVRTNLFNIYRYWIETADLDGFRIDTVKHAEIGFWQYFNPAIRTYAASIGKSNFFQFGEVYDGSESKCGYYTGTKAGGAFCNDSTLDFPLYFKANDVFAKASGNTTQLETHNSAVNTYFDAAARDRLVTFLDNHDVTRFLNSGNANNNTNRLVLGLDFLYTSRGIPCLYYGTEQAFNGGTDPNNREDMFAGLFEQGPSRGDNFDFTHGLFQHVARLNNFRRLYPSLRSGSHVSLWNNASGPGLYTYARRLGAEEVIVVLNTASGSQTLPARPTTYGAGTPLVNLLNTNETVTVTSGTDGFPSITVPGASAKMFISSALWQPLDPVVTRQEPAHGAVNAAPLSSIVLNFSQPMNTSAVEAAFSIQPARSGSISWSASRTEMTFVPDPPGFAASSTNVVRLETNATDTISGNALHAAFETYFVTSTSTVTDVMAPTLVMAQPVQGSTISGALVLSGTAADNVAVNRVEWRLDENDWAIATGTTNWSTSLDSSLFLNGSHTLYARAYDPQGNVSTTATATVRLFNIPTDYVRRISPGNPSAVTNCSGDVWVADRPYAVGSYGYSGGASGHLAHTISGVCAQAQSLYQRERYSTPASSFRYLFDCPPGLYEVTLLEAETWVSGPNQRLFDAYLEGVKVLTNFDILATAGGADTPLTLTFTSLVTDAQVEFQFFPLVDNARASGIQVRRLADLDSDGDGIPDWWVRAYFDHDMGQQADGSRAEDDPDSDGMNNFAEFVAFTDPLDSGSVFRIESFVSENGQGLTFHSVSGRLYAVEGLYELGSTDQWVNVESDLPGTNGTMSVVDTNKVARRLYRLRVTRP
ncbi:MAG: Ig-like domain-containing protein [Verrucomicrobia bacterium]|nr:Ig-like domain-containing protein [Verrucomicrobiota bacterium]